MKSEAKSPLWKRLLPMVIALGIIVFIFGWVLPQTIDYEAVFREIGEIQLEEWALLVVIAGLRLIPEAWVYVAAQPGLTTGRGLSLFLVSNALGMVPPGGLDLISRFQMSRGWGYSASESTSATIGSFIFSTFGKLIMPVIAVVLLSMRRVQDDGMDTLAWIGIFGVVVGGGVLFLMIRSEKLAARVGTVIGAFVNWIAGWFRRELKTDFRQLLLDFREHISELLKTRSLVGTLSGLAAQIAGFLVLLTAIRAVGLDAETLDWVVIFAAYSVVAVVLAIPLMGTPGLAEAIYIGALNQVSGGGVADELAAAVFVFRVLTWLAPIPIGAIAFSRWRKESQGVRGADPFDNFATGD